MTRSKLFALLGAIVLLVSAFSIPGVAAQTASADSDLPGGIGHFYTQANGGAGPQFGYRITDEGGIKFWSEFQRLGGVNALGYPASRRFTLDGFTVQATQKVIMQWRPEVNQVYFVNVFDQLHDKGYDSPLQATYQIPPQLDPSFDAGKTPAQAQAARLALLNADPAIAARYNAAGAQSILYNGLPTSKVTDEGPFVTLRAQRVAFQHWKVDNAAAGIKAGDVTVVNGGDVAKKLNLAPASAIVTEDINGTPSATPTPVATSTPVATATPSFPYLYKSVNTPPLDCGSGNRVPCVDSAPNSGLQYVQGHVVDKDGHGISGITIRTTFYGNSIDVGTEADGLFTFTIAANCPHEQRIYNMFIIDGQGRQSSDVHTVTYSDCTQAGEFHFDFVRQS